MDRPSICIILDKKYNIANSSCHFGSYRSIWTGPSPKKYYMDLSWTGHQKNIIWTSEASVHIKFFWWRTGPYTAIWPSVPWTICYIYKSNLRYYNYSSGIHFAKELNKIYLSKKKQNKKSKGTTKNRMFRCVVYMSNELISKIIWLFLFGCLFCFLYFLWIVGIILKYTLV
jgi:hypothetical protein